MVRLNDLKGLLKPKWFCDSVSYVKVVYWFYIALNGCGQCLALVRQVCAGRLLPTEKRLEMHWACCFILLPDVLFIHFILHCLVKNSSLCSSGFLQELPKSSSLQTLQKHLSPLMMWSMWLILEKWKRKGTGIHSSGLCDLGNCSMPWATYFSVPKSWEKLDGTSFSESFCKGRKSV